LTLTRFDLTASGSVELSQTPGPYLVAAVDVEPHRLRDDAELMERARAGAVPVEIREGEQTRLNVRLVRLQPFIQSP